MQSDITANGDIVANKPVADVGEVITFNIINSGVGGGLTSHFIINFHDGSALVELDNVFTIDHSFIFEGSYTITMVAISNYGLTATTHTTVAIVNQRPAVDIVMPATAVEDQAVTVSIYNATSATYPDTDHDKGLLRYQWMLGDGTTREGPAFTKSWDQSGDYPVHVYVSDDQGAIGYGRTTIHVANVAPAAGFTWSPVPASENLGEDVRLLFDASPSSDTPSDIAGLKYYWDFGDGQVGRGKLQHHVFTASADFDVTLIVIDNDGARDVTTKVVSIPNTTPQVAVTGSGQLREGDTGWYGAVVDDTFTDSHFITYDWSVGGNGSLATRLWEDDYQGLVSVAVTDRDGATDIGSIAARVMNTNPYIMVDSINMLGTIRLDMAGTPNNTLFMRVLRNGEEVDYAYLARDSWCNRPGNTSATLPMDFDLSQEWAIEVFYGHLNDSMVVNETGTPNGHDLTTNSTDDFVVVGPRPGARGANPAWLTFTFIDGISFTLFNMFWAWCNRSWVWRIDPRDYLITSTLTLEGRVLDRGHDALDVTITYGDEVATVNSAGNSGHVNFSFNIHGSDNWGNYWEGLWDTWWSKFDEYWGGWSDDFEAWWDWWWSQHWWLTLISWWFDYLNRFSGVDDWFDVIFGGDPWDDDWFGCWNNDWCDWWDDVWYNASSIYWDDIIIDAVDDDGGQARLTVTLNSIGGVPKVVNLSPRVELVLPPGIVQDCNATFEVHAVDHYNTWNVTAPGDLSYTWDFGDGTVLPGGATATHLFTRAGTYMIQVLVSDGQYTSTSIEIVQVENVAPWGGIYGPQNLTEDQAANFTIEHRFFDTASDNATLRFTWTFDDYNNNTMATGAGRTISHAWANPGYYWVRVYATDVHGTVTMEELALGVGEKKPTINGPFGIDVAEGNLVSYSITYEDTVLDEPDLQFLWDIPGAGNVSNARRFQALLSPGNYTGSLTISSAGLNNTSTNTTEMVTINVVNAMPSATIQNHVFYGPAQGIELTAHGFDAGSAIEELAYTWTMNGTFEVIEQTGGILDGSGSWSTIRWVPPHSGSFDCRVTVEDLAHQSAQTQFFVEVTLDADSDGVPDEVEASYGTSSGSVDTDGDFLSDWYEMYVSFTNAVLYDTDGDGLWDGVDPSTNRGEAYYGTNPKSWDSDGDGLSDGFEIQGWTVKVQRNGTWVEYHVDSEPLVVDTDSDGLTDFQEYNNGINSTDPRNNDTNMDGISDFDQSEWALYVDRDGDGIPDVREVAGFMLRFPDGTERHVYSNASVNDTDSDGLSDYEEWYPGADGFVTDPWSNDTDADGMLDSAEMFSKVQEYGRREKIADQTEGYFYFYANFGPNLKNITVTFGATTGENHSADFNAIVKYQGTTIIENSTSGATYYFNATDVTGETSSQANGLWELLITPDGSDALLELFKVEAAVQVHPLKPDTDGDGLLDGAEVNGTNGWITDPTLLDTDGDGWNDTREIEVEHTNPLEADTDGDGVRDPSDKDPIRNVVVKVAVDWAQWGDAYWLDLDINSPNPELAVVTTVDGLSIATTKQTADGNPVARHVYGYYWGVINTYGKLWPWEWLWGWIRYDVVPQWTIGTNATFDTDGDKASNFFYFFDVPDDRSTVTIGTQLWQIFQGTERTGEQRMAGTGTYNVVGTNHTAPVEIVAGNNRVHYTATTIGLDKVNTIAVYKNETTFVDDHYGTISQQNLVFLDITDDDFTHPAFTPGMNVIVIPTDIFADTKLHKIIELAIDSEGALNMSMLPDFLQAATFSGIDRTRQSISRHVESVINATVSLANATAILDLILTLASNESVTDGFLAKRVNACRLGVAADVLALIAWDGAIMRTQTDGGPMPGTWYGNLWEGVTAVFTLLWGGIVAIFNLFAQLFTALINWGLKVVGEFATAAVRLIELLVKAIILTVAYLLLALAIIEMVLMWGFLILALASLILILPNPPYAFLFGMAYSGNDFSFRYEESIQWRYIDFVDLTLPVIRTETFFNGQLASWEENNVLLFTSSSGEGPDSPSQSMMIDENSVAINSNGGDSPTFSNLVISPSRSVAQGVPIEITIDVNSIFPLQEVKLESEGSIWQMHKVDGMVNTWRSNSITPPDFGQFIFSIIATDIDGNSNSISFYIEIFIPLNPAEKQLVKNKIAAGASVPMIVGGLIMSLIGLYALFEPDKSKQAVILSVGFLLGLANLLTSVALLARNLDKNLLRPDNTPQEALMDASYLFGIYIGAFITFVTFIIAATVVYLFQSMGKDVAKAFGELAKPLGFIFLGIKLFEILTGFKLLGGQNDWPGGGYLSIWMQDAMVGVVFALLLGGTIFGSVAAISKKVNNAPKVMTISSALFFCLFVFGLLLFRTNNMQFIGSIMHAYGP
ncbi:MAG: PKD domain-containing protein [Candidatus Lokiarchaeota archaeon]|nr:PKD domain-containing protein [Candidatus Lokiarchaeota archaeon]